MHYIHPGGVTTEPIDYELLCDAVLANPNSGEAATRWIPRLQGKKIRFGVEEARSS